MLRDVWTCNENRPNGLFIKFITDDEACKINNFKLNYFTPTHSFEKERNIVEKIDKILSKKFWFYYEQWKWLSFT